MAKQQTSDESRAAEIEEIVQQVKSDFADRDKLYRDVDAVLFNELPVKIPDAYKKTAMEVKSPLAGHIANTVTSALTVNPPTVQFEPTGFGTSYTENATLREHFFEASWRRQEEEARQRLFRKFMYSLVTKGEGVLKTLERQKAAWSSYDDFSKKLVAELGADERLDDDSRNRIFDARTEEYKRGAPYPIRTTFVHPSTFYYQKGEDGFTFCCEVKEVPYADVLARYSSKASIAGDGKVVPAAMGLPRPQWSQAMGKQKTLTMIEAWDSTEAVYILKGKDQKNGLAVKRLKHGYGDRYTLKGPYSHALGITTDSNLPDRAGLGILYGFLPLFPLLNSLLTIESQVAYIFGYPSFKRVGQPGQGFAAAPFGSDNTEKEDEDEVIPGTIYPYDIAPVEPPHGVELVDKMIAMVREMLNLALPSVVQGMVDSDQSGYALNQAAHLARLAWDPIVDNAQFAHSERVGFESWLIENKIKEDVYVWGKLPAKAHKKGNARGWLRMGPEALNGVHRYNVRLDPETPSNKLLELRFHAEAVKGRFETQAMGVEEMGNSADEVEKGLLLEDMKQDPAIREAVRQNILQKLGTIQQKQAQQAGLVDQGMSGGQPGAELGQAGQVFAPGQGMPLAPTPQGAVTGMGGGGLAGAPTAQSLPQRHQPLPGQA